MPWTHSWLDVSVVGHGLGTREVACGPSLHVNQRCRPGYLWFDRSNVKEEFAFCSSAVLLAVRSPVVRFGFVSWSGPDVALVVGVPVVQCRVPQPQLKLSLQVLTIH